MEVEEEEEEEEEEEGVTTWPMTRSPLSSSFLGTAEHRNASGPRRGPCEVSGHVRGLGTVSMPTSWVSTRQCGRARGLITGWG